METSVKNIYAAGDCVESLDILSNQNKVLALWPNAYMQGETAGSNMSGVENKFAGSFAMNAIGFFGIQLISAGIVDPKDEKVSIYIEENEKEITYKKLLTLNNKLIGFALLNLPDRAGIYTSLINDDVKLDSLNYDITKKDIGLNVFPQDIRHNKLFRGNNK
jgi:NAD(P)H-nitrite reductase large subunit